MSLVVPASGEALLLQYIVGKIEAGSPVLHLFSNDYWPTEATVISDLVECTVPGYSPITLSSENWSIDNSTGVVAVVYPEQFFSFASAASNYGYFLTDSLGNLLVLGRFPAAPYQSPDNGGKIYVEPGMTLRSDDSNVS